MSAWDNDLQRLADAVEQTLGKEALNAAIVRAYTSAAASVKAADPGSAMPFQECLRIELRRLLKVH